MNLRTRYFLLMGFSSILIGSLLSELKGQPMPTKTPYYIDVNKVQKDKPYSVEIGNLNLQYYDAYGKVNEFPLTIYDWKKTVVATLQLTKSFGLNHFNIDLKDVYTDWKTGYTYRCELRDEAGAKYEVLIRLVEPPVKAAPEVDIFVNPITVNCKELVNNLVEFYGQVSGGKAPYVLDWFILNNSRNDFLYQPRSEQIAKPGKSMMVEVDKAPDYFVLLKVKDACGSTSQKMVHLGCETTRNKINTVLVEPLNDTSLKPINQQPSKIK